MTVWIVVFAIGAATIALKAAGPLLLARRPLGARAVRVVELVAPVMLVALVVTQTLGGDQAVVVDERVPGVLAAGIALWRGASIVPAMAIAAGVTALLRAVG
jgi:branched-subunit amino acid transport protein